MLFTFSTAQNSQIIPEFIKLAQPISKAVLYKVCLSMKIFYMAVFLILRTLTYFHCTVSLWEGLWELQNLHFFRFVFCVSTCLFSNYLTHFLYTDQLFFRICILYRSSNHYMYFCIHVGTRLAYFKLLTNYSWIS